MVVYLALSSKKRAGTTKRQENKEQGGRESTCRQFGIFANTGAEGVQLHDEVPPSQNEVPPSQNIVLQPNKELKELRGALDNIAKHDQRSMRLKPLHRLELVRRNRRELVRRNRRELVRRNWFFSAPPGLNDENLFNPKFKDILLRKSKGEKVSAEEETYVKNLLSQKKESLRLEQSTIQPPSPK